MAKQWDPVGGGPFGLVGQVTIAPGVTRQKLRDCAPSVAVPASVPTSGGAAASDSASGSRAWFGPVAAHPASETSAKKWVYLMTPSI
jgi:hypothetical protein